MVGFEGTGGAADCPTAALTFLGRPLGRGGLTASVVAEGGWGRVGLVGAGASSPVVRASGTPCKAILAAKASSTRLASSADRRFLAFRMAIARGCRSTSGRVSISRISCARIAVDSSAFIFANRRDTGVAVSKRARADWRRRGAGTRSNADFYGMLDFGSVPNRAKHRYSASRQSLTYATAYAISKQ